MSMFNIVAAVKTGKCPEMELGCAGQRLNGTADESAPKKARALAGTQEQSGSPNNQKNFLG